MTFDLFRAKLHSIRGIIRGSLYLERNINFVDYLKINYETVAELSRISN